MVARWRGKTEPRLFPHRGYRRPSLLALSRRVLRARNRDALVHARALCMTEFAELCAATNFSFLRGASHPAEMVIQAQSIGLKGIAIADRNTLAGVVRGR